MKKHHPDLKTTLVLIILLEENEHQQQQNLKKTLYIYHTMCVYLFRSV